MFIISGLYTDSKQSFSVNEIFNPERIDEFYAAPETERRDSITSDRATNYGVVRMELIDKIYNDMYMQKLKSRNEKDWQQRILPRREIVQIDSQSATDGRLTLHLRSVTQKQQEDKEEVPEILNIDALILATGYTRNAHERILAQCEHLSQSAGWKVNRDYSLALDRDKVQSGVGIWLQGCNESTHGISDSLLSVLATRSGEMVESIFGLSGSANHQKTGVRAML